MKMTRAIIVPLSLALSLSTVAGCGKKSDSGSDPKTAAEKPAAEKPAAEKPAAEKPAAEKPAAEKPTGEKPAAEKPAGEKPAVEKPAVEKPAVEKPAVEKPKTAKAPAHPRPKKDACKRLCNKQQVCGVPGSGSVVTCVEDCYRVWDATAGDDAEKARALRAQDRCADRMCKDFEPCVKRVLFGETAMKKSPRLETEEAQKRCKVICEKEKTCSPEIFQQRRGGMPACLQVCGLTMTSDDERAGLSRVMLYRTWACRDAECDKLTECMRATKQ